MTLVYILFNLPVFLNYTRYIVAVYVTGKDFLDSDNSNTFLQEYIWLLTYIITVALNSLVNPVIYMLRMRRFRAEALNIFKRDAVIVYNTHSHTEQNNVILANRSAVKNNSTRSCATSSTLPTNQDSLKSALRKPSVCSIGLGTADIRADPPRGVAEQ